MPVSRFVRPTLLSLAAACALAVVGCGGSSPESAVPDAPATGRILDTKVVAIAITDSIREQRNATAEVDCPEGIVQAKGVRFVCEATSRFGRTPFVVTQTDDEGNVEYVAAEDE